MTTNGKKWIWSAIVGAIAVLITVLGITFSAASSRTAIEKDIDVLRRDTTKHNDMIEMLRGESIQHDRKLIEISTKLDVAQRDITKILNHIERGN